MEKIILGDCLNELKKMADNTVDHVITSPPYNMNLRIRNGKYCSRQIVKEFSTKYEGFTDNLPIEEYYEYHKKVIEELMRVTKHYVFYVVQAVTGNKRAIFKLIGDFNKNIKEIIIWNKTTGQPAMAEKVMNSVYEYLIVFSKDENDTISRQFKDANFKRGTLNNLWNIKRQRSVSNLHAATFPEELSDLIIKNFTKKNEVILDPFSGTGTTGVSCIKYHRDYIGIELLQNYIDISIKRFNEIKAKLS